MNNYNNDRNFSAPRGRGGFGGRDSGRPSFGGRNSGGNGGTTLHDAVCAECGNNCKVPFFPTGSRPVFCSDCFEKRDGMQDNFRAPRRENFDRPNFSEKRSYPTPEAVNNRDKYLPKSEIDQMNAKLDKILKTLNYMINKDAAPATADSATAEKKAKKTPAENSLSEMVASLVEETSEKTSSKSKAKKPRAKKTSK